MSTESVEIAWNSTILPRIQQIHAHLMRPSEPPLLMVSERLDQGENLALAIANFMISEGRTLEIICLEDVPYFPPRLIQTWYPYAPRQVLRSERIIAGTTANELINEGIENTNMSEDQLNRLKANWERLAEMQRKNRNGLRLIDLFVSPTSLTALKRFNHPEIVEKLVILGGQRYRDIYWASYQI